MIICFPVTLNLPSSRDGLISLGHNHCIPSLGSVLELDACHPPHIAASWEDQTGNCCGARTMAPFACKEGAEPASRAQSHHPVSSQREGSLSTCCRRPHPSTQAPTVTQPRAHPHPLWSEAGIRRALHPEQPRCCAPGEGPPSRPTQTL